MPFPFAAVGAGLTGLGIISDFFGGSADRDQAAELNRQNLDYQKQFAQQGIRWRVQDAEAAGLHPLAALGASGAQFSPVTAFAPSPKVGSQLGQMGQQLSSMQGSEYKNLLIDEKRQDIRYKTAMADKAEQDFHNMGQSPTTSAAALTPSEKYILGRSRSGQPKLTQVMPDEVIYHKSGISPAIKGTFDFRERPDGVIMVTPKEELGEILESSLPDWIRHIAFQLQETGGSWAGVNTKAKQKIMEQIPHKPGYKIMWSRGWAAPRYVKWHKTRKSKLNKDNYRRSNETRRKILDRIGGWNHLRDYGRRPGK